MNDVGAHVGLGAIDQLLDLLQERVDQPRSASTHERVAARVAHFHVTSDGLRITASQRGGRMRATGQVKRFEDLHDLPVRLRQRFLRRTLDTGGTVERTRRRGRSGGHRRGYQLSADREFPCPSARTVVSAYREYPLSVVRGP